MRDVSRIRSIMTGIFRPADSEPTGPPHPQYPVPGKPRSKRQKLGLPAETIPYGALDTLQYHTPPKVCDMGYLGELANKFSGSSKRVWAYF